MTDTFPFSLTDIQGRFGTALYSASFVVQDGAAYWLHKGKAGKQLAVLAPPAHPTLARFQGEQHEFGEGYTLRLCPTNHANARALRAALPWLNPIPLGLATSAGFGDRLGMATPGHVRALGRVRREAPARAIMPIFAQQSIREMQRTHRSPDDVLADATWGAFQGGWGGPVGADADHLKTPADIDACATVGFTLFTIDPGAYVDSEAEKTTPAMLEAKVVALPWQDLESTPTDLKKRYAGVTLHIEDLAIPLDTPAVLRAAAKYGRALAHVAAMARHLASKGIPHELEISVDETETPTTPVEHIYIASELKRLGVRWVSLAPRYGGRFEKGVDYIGDPRALAQELAIHAAIARVLGPYKLSLHSGSDKFSVYPLIAEAAQGLVHLKTAGTSYLEALRVVAQAKPAFFREIASLARERYPQDRATYHVSAELSHMPDLADLPDSRLTEILENFHARQVLHVTFGSAIDRFGPQLLEVLRTHEEAYYAALEHHFYRHLKPFAHMATHRP